MIEQPHQPGYSTGTLYRCGREACSGYWDATGRPAPEGTLICRAPLCGDACERVPASTDVSRPYDHIHDFDERGV